MNHTFSLIRSAMTRSYQPFSEHAKRSRKGKHGKLLMAAVIASAAQGALAGPQGGTVVDGSALINYQDALTLINQHSDAVTINWQNFDIAAGETVTFLQPDASAYALNRVLTGDGTEIHGQLNANGRVFILDANGVLFGKSAQVNVGSLVASALDLDEADFARGHFSFTGKDKTGQVTNLGNITVADTGSVALLGGQVSNQGVIRARLGSVALAAGQKMTLDFAGDGLLNVQIDEGTARALVNNGGLIQADGGSVLMTAHASDALLQTVVNNTGVIEARTLQERDGKIMLLGGFDGGSVQVAGKLDASAPEGGDGGFIETSGAIVKISGQATITAAAAQGEAGTWLLDPTNLEISYRADGAADNISHAHSQTLQNSLNGGTNVVLETAAAGNQSGDITLVDPLVWSGPASLSLTAHRHIRFNDYLHAPTGGLILSAGNNILTGAEGHINVGTFTLRNGNWNQIGANLPTFMARDFRLEGGSFMRAQGGTGSSASPWQLIDIYGLQGLATRPAGHAVLTGNLNASGTALWNSGAGFNPIGTDSTAFTGSLNGAGFVIDGLTINRPGQDLVGLFGNLGAGSSVSRLGLENVAITGAAEVGSFAGKSEGSLGLSYATGSVTGTSGVGGLVGGLVGDPTDLSGGSILHSYSTVAVSSQSRAGGVAGWSSGQIGQSYATGEVSGDDFVGGLVGYNLGGLQQTYASGQVSGSSSVGGLAGENDGLVVDSFYDAFTTGQVVMAGAGNILGGSSVNGDWASLDPSNSAYASSNYAGFDFANTWFIAEGSSRPMLRAFLSGDGSIANLYQLQGMAADLSGSYFLVGDIDAAATAASVAAGNSGNYSDVWGGRGFAPVGKDFNTGFTGSLDGEGHVIRGLTIARADQTYVGLFGYLGSDASVSHLGLENAVITGGISVGSLAGASDGKISVTYASGEVNGEEEVGGLVGGHHGTLTHSYSTVVVAGEIAVGGLVGANQGDIGQSYATGAVTGDFRVGGLVGYNAGEVVQSYATGRVSGATVMGGLVGENAGIVADSAYDAFTTGQVVMAGAGNILGGSSVNGDWASLDPSNSAYASSNYAGFDFANTWFIAEGLSRPMLRAFLSSDGSIANLYQLQGMAADLSGSYFLVGDIDAAATAASVAAGNSGNYSDVWGGRGFAPVGESGFTGSLDGQGYAISGLAMHRLNGGLFGALDGSVSDLRLMDVAISGSGNGDGLNGPEAAGALAGIAGANTSIRNVSAQGSIDSFAGAGGLVAVNLGSIETSSADIALDNIMAAAGGLVAFNVGSVSRSYATGDIRVIPSGGVNAASGGLVGMNAGEISRSYATGRVQGGEFSGGLVGINGDGSQIVDSYATGSASGTTASGGLAGGNGGEIIRSFGMGSLEGINTYDAVTGNIDAVSRALTGAEFVDPTTFIAWGQSINSTGAGNAVWRIYEGQTSPLLRAFLTDIEVTAYDDLTTYDGTAYAGRHQINGTRGNGVRYGNSYAEFLAAFGADGTPYGATDALGSSDLQYKGNSQGASNAGVYELTADRLWSHQQGFNIRTPRSQLEIEAQIIALTLDIDDASKVYGELDPAFTWRVTSGALGAGDTLTGVLSREAGEDVGNYAITGRVTGDLASPNYQVTIQDGVFTITPRPITLSIADLEKVYGNADPELAWQITSGSLAGRDGDIADLIALSREAGEDVGSYAISGLLAEALTGGNYELTVNNGNLVITPRALEISADVLSKIYGQADPQAGWEITGGSIVDGDTLVVEVSRDEGRDVGSYAIRLSLAGDVASSGNYQITTHDGSLTINPAALTVTAEDIRTYWNLLPPYSASVEGLVEGDSVSDVFGDSLVVTSDLQLPIPGDYRLTPSARLLSDNYTVSFVEGTLSLLSSHPGGNYGTALTASQLPAREALGRENRANIFEARPLLDGSESGITLQVLDGGVRLDPDRLAALGLVFPAPVRFPVNSSVIADSYLADLRRFAAQLQRYPGVQVLVEGHTSSTGSLALNDRLSRARADAVAAALQGMGVAENRIRKDAFNYQYPVASNDTLEGRLLNQRTEVSEDKESPAQDPQ